jgi:hypothetical protein
MNPIIIRKVLPIRGDVIVRSHPAGTIDAVKDLMRRGEAQKAQELILKGKTEVLQKNLVVDSSNYGIDILVQFLLSGFTGINPFPFGPSWGEIGTGHTTPSLADTALTTPTNRAVISNALDNGFNQAQLQFFFPDSVLTNTTYYEFGTFVGGDSTIGTGNMFNHALFDTPYSKSSGSDTTVQVNFTISNA